MACGPVSTAASPVPSSSQVPISSPSSAAAALGQPSPIPWIATEPDPTRLSACRARDLVFTMTSGWGVMQGSPSFAVGVAYGEYAASSTSRLTPCAIPNPVVRLFDAAGAELAKTGAEPTSSDDPLLLQPHSQTKADELFLFHISV